jgi:GT2 family glycosyltransferase
VKLKPKEIIVVDQNSTDGTKELAKKYPIKLIRINGYPAKLRNTGIFAASSEIVAVIDDDMVVAEGWTEQILEPYSRPDVGGVGGRVIPYGESLNYWVPAANNIIGKIKKDGFIIGNFDIPAKNPLEVECLPGGNVSWRRDIVLKVNGIDERYRGVRWHDTDLDVAIRRLGYKLVYQSSAVVWHKRKGKDTFPPNEFAYWDRRNYTYFYFKNIFSDHKAFFPFFLKTLFLPPKDYLRKSEAKVKINIPLFLAVIQGLIDGYLTSIGIERLRELKYAN